MHWHRWKAIDAQALNEHATNTLTGEKNTVGMFTMVLYRCECGKLKSERIDGHWSRESVVAQAKGDRE